MSSIYDALKRIQEERERITSRYVIYPAIRIKKSIPAWLITLIVAGGVASGFVLALSMRDSLITSKKAEHKVNASVVSRVIPQEISPRLLTRLKSEGQNQGHTTNLVHSLMFRADVKKNRGDLIGAMNLYNKVIKMDPNAVEAYIKLGNIYFATKDYEKALGMYTKAEELKKDDARILNNIGSILFIKGDVGNAIFYFKRAMALSNDYAEPAYNMACAYARKGDIHQALTLLRKALSISSDVRSWALSDPDLKVLRNTREFSTMLGLR
ncbi:MAG: tetratricopeptide repeat protein [Deltaproteobacteria bacterium]|nr:tetratricopeptide repeat protein [Deltaproteobacteria bacterium]